MPMTETLVGTLSLDKASDRRAFLIDRINEIIKPPCSVTEDSVNIRAMYVVNDLVNSHGGRFHRDDLELIKRLILDSPVLVGHDRAKLPLARTFHAEIELRDGATWLKSYFYWPKAADPSSDDLLRKIDSGVYKECSISFNYTIPLCSECSRDFRECPHRIGQETSDGRGVHFLYHDITQVLETSLVFKGSVKGTYITDKLSLDLSTLSHAAQARKPADSSFGKRSIIAIWRGQHYTAVREGWKDSCIPKNRS